MSGEDTLFGLDEQGGGEISRDTVAQVWSVGHSSHTVWGTSLNRNLNVSYQKLDTEDLGWISDLCSSGRLQVLAASLQQTSSTNKVCQWAGQGRLGRAGQVGRVRTGGIEH